jgi:transcriptional regulator with XRE-family HTH domain
MADAEDADDATVLSSGERFAQLIRTARQDAGLSQEELAHQVGLSRVTLVRWESGDTTRPEPAQVRAVCLLLDIDPREAAIALGYITREEAYSSEPKLLPPFIEEVIELLGNPAVSDAEKERWVDYLRYLIDKPRPSKAAMKTTTTRTTSKTVKDGKITGSTATGRATKTPTSGSTRIGATSAASRMAALERDLQRALHQQTREQQRAAEAAAKTAALQRRLARLQSQAVRNPPGTSSK